MATVVLWHHSKRGAETFPRGSFKGKKFAKLGLNVIKSANPPRNCPSAATHHRYHIQKQQICIRKGHQNSLTTRLCGGGGDGDDDDRR